MFPKKEGYPKEYMKKRLRNCRSTAKKISLSLFIIVGHAVARRHEHRRISFCARGIIIAKEEAKPSALAHVGRTLNDELDTARMREKERRRDRKRWSKRERRIRRACASENRGEKRKRKEETATSRTPTHFYLVFFILDETNDVHKSIDPLRLPFLISLFQVTLEMRIRLSTQLLFSTLTV